MLIYPELNEFKEYCKKGTVVPIYTRILADVETPISAYMKISDQEDFSFLLESVSGEDKFARYTFLGANPFLKIYSKNNKMYEIVDGHETVYDIEEGKDPLHYLKTIMDKYKPVEMPGLPPFYGGAVGYLGYDMIRYFEDIPNKNEDTIDVPIMYFMLTDTIVAFDRFKQELLIICNVFLDEDFDQEEQYKASVEKIKKIYDKLENSEKTYFMDEVTTDYEVKSNFEKEKFCDAVNKAKEYIKAGDIFQVVLSQRFYIENYINDPFSTYRRLRSINPSPYMFYLDLDEIKIAGASPEILVKLEGETVTVRPIAGTRKRGKTIEEDIANEKDLLSDEKEIAEHVMLVDLGRNDVGRISEYGSVEVKEKMVIERYSHVMHIVSSVQGKIRGDRDSFDVFRATFPAGTLSGAPKIRAMEIIEELEPDRRAIYGGAIGYFNFNGDFDSCITIRTIVFKDNKAYMQAGAGIVYDSVPEKEYEETENKIAAVIKALG